MTDSRMSPEQRDRKMPAATSIDDRWELGASSGRASTAGGVAPASKVSGVSGSGSAGVDTGSGSTSTRRCSPVDHGARGWLITPGDSVVRPTTSSTMGSSMVAASGSYQPGTGLVSAGGSERLGVPEAN